MHPFLFAIQPVLSLYAANAAEVSPRELVLPLAAVLCVSAIALPVLARLVRSRAKASLLLSVFWVWLFLFGPVVRTLRTHLSPAMESALAWRWMFLLFPLLILLALLIREERCRVLSRFAHAVSLIAVAVPLLLLLRAPAALQASAVRGAPAAEESVAVQREQAEKPHIFYIVLDEYTRADILRDRFGYDNTPFLSFLRNRGFFVGEESVSNYSQTVLSLASSLNMEYIPTLLGERGGANVRRKEAYALSMSLLRRGAAAERLRREGYATANISTHPYSFIPEADYVMPANVASLSEFQSLLWDGTPLAGILTGFSGAQFDEHRRRLLLAFQMMASIADADRPTFVIAHIMLPHPPFVFDAQGNPRDPPGAFSFDTADDYIVSDAARAAYREGYAQQLTFANVQLKELIDRILASDHPAVIILQGDHGSSLGTSFRSAEKTDMRERMAILNAFYFPGRRYASLSAGISPVNVFRATFNEVFGAALPLLPDRSFYSTHRLPFAMQDVTAAPR